MKVINDTYEMVPVGDLKHHPRNPNKGNVDAIVESIKANGFYGALVVQRGTSFVLAGNHRLRAAQACGIEAVPVTWVECDERQAIKIVLADNRTSELAERDPEVLATLLRELEHDGDLAGTGYDSGDLERIMEALTPACEEAWGDAFDALSSEEPERTDALTFRLTADGLEVVQDALTRAGRPKDVAIVEICEAYLG